MLEQKIRDRSAHIAIAGLGYVGLPLSLSFARAGFSVTGLDVQQKKVDAVNNGLSYIDNERHTKEKGIQTLNIVF